MIQIIKVNAVCIPKIMIPVYKIILKYLNSYVCICSYKTFNGTISIACNIKYLLKELFNLNTVRISLLLKQFSIKPPIFIVLYAVIFLILEQKYHNHKKIIVSGDKSVNYFLLEYRNIFNFCQRHSCKNKQFP